MNKCCFRASLSSHRSSASPYHLSEKEVHVRPSEQPRRRTRPNSGRIFLIPSIFHPHATACDHMRPCFRESPLSELGFLPVSLCTSFQRRLLNTPDFFFFSFFSFIFFNRFFNQCFSSTCDAYGWFYRFGVMISDGWPKPSVYIIYATTTIVTIITFRIINWLTQV